ncbi:hypothetical protein B5G34_00845 [Flavonifractor sp. An82]|uniref:hypothetical protein n=1 Tax=Flavonifractor sp. An82 TaxID=1965660 RepID=UPI000B3A9225|nr:hypothetical protein [Flavonifractor sp. An82]OUN23675.1 hypothetical protein B5G34_00845 [Flavonifractor sp. An82]
MGTIADKLAKLAATKADLKAALAEKGQTVGDVFSTYPAVVRAIETGGKKTIITYDFLAASAEFYFVNSDNELKHYIRQSFSETVLSGQLIFCKCGSGVARNIFVEGAKIVESYNDMMSDYIIFVSD